MVLPLNKDFFETSLSGSLFSFTHLSCRTLVWGFLCNTVKKILCTVTCPVQNLKKICSQVLSVLINMNLLLGSGLCNMYILKQLRVKLDYIIMNFVNDFLL